MCRWGLRPGWRVLTRPSPSGARADASDVGPQPPFGGCWAWGVRLRFVRLPGTGTAGAPRHLAEDARSTAIWRVTGMLTVVMRRGGPGAHRMKPRRSTAVATGTLVRPPASHVNHSRSTSAIRNGGTSVRADCRTTKWKKTSVGNEGIERWTDAPLLSEIQSSIPGRVTQWPNHQPTSRIRR